MKAAIQQFDRVSYVAAVPRGSKTEKENVTGIVQDVTYDEVFVTRDSKGSTKLDVRKHQDVTVIGTAVPKRREKKSKKDVDNTRRMP